MIIKNAKIVLKNEIIKNGFIEFSKGKITNVSEGRYFGKDASIDVKGKIVMPGFIDVHVHGSAGIDFMDATIEDYKKISESLFNEGVTTYLATTLTSDNTSLTKVCETVANASKENSSLYGIHLEGPYISVKYKGAQNEKYIRKPDVKELRQLIKSSNGLVRYISLAPEHENACNFIKEAVKLGVVCSCGHTDATFINVEDAIKAGLTNLTHTHNAMSPYHHRNPGVMNAAFYFDELNCELICDRIHVCDDTLKTFVKAVGPDRIIMITDALKIKNSDIKEFQLFGLDCEAKNGAAYLKAGPLAGSLLTMDKGIRNMKEVCNLSLCELAKISSYNAAKSLHLNDRGEIAVGKLADLVILDENLFVSEVYKLGERVR